MASATAIPRERGDKGITRERSYVYLNARALKSPLPKQMPRGDTPRVKEFIVKLSKNKKRLKNKRQMEICTCLFFNIFFSYVQSCK